MNSTIMYFNPGPAVDADRAFAASTEGARALQAIAAEFGDYSKRLVEDGTTTLTQFVHASSPPEAFNVLAAYGKRTTEEYMQQMTRIANMYSSVIHDQTLALQSMMTPGARF